MGTLKGMRHISLGVLFLCGLIILKKGREKMKIKMRDGSMKEAAFEEELGRDAFRHTTAHILAQAVKRLYPDAKCGKS